MTLSATLHLKRAFIEPVTSGNYRDVSLDPAQYVTAGTSGSIGGGGQRSQVGVQEGEFRTYANNVTRLIVGAASNKQLTFTLRALTPAQLSLLKTMVGKTCLFRDTYGRRMFGSFLVTTETDIPMSGTANSTLLTDVGIAFQEVTFTEGV
jgi:hypothetical protein